MNCTLALCALALSASFALADVNGLVILQANKALSLDNGTLRASGGDILWTVGTIAPQGSATAYALGSAGLTNCTGLSQSYYQSFEKAASANPIPSPKLGPGSAFIVVTSGGHLSIVCVTANDGAAISLLFTTYGASAAAGTPLIAQILNNSSGTPLGYPNYGIAPSSLFIVRGTSLANPGAPALQSSAPPGLPLTLNGASITVVVNGVTTNPPIYYTSPTQLAAVLPASTPVGTGSLTVTYQNVTSAPAPIQVIPSAVGINYYNSNTAVATDAASGALLTYTSAGRPGQTIVLWTTGLGADPADSDSVFATTPHRVNTPLQVYVGGIAATILYQGSSGYPGVNQIDLTIPASAPTGCWVSVIAVTGNTISNAATLPIDNAAGACVDVVSGLNGNQLAASGQHTLRTGVMTLVHSVTVNKDGSKTTSNDTNGAFEKYTGIYSPSRQLSPGNCTVGPPVIVPVGTLTALDVGSLSLSGPDGLSVTLGPQDVKGAFNALLSATAIPSTGGTFTFKGSGGKDVGAFTSSVTLSNPVLVSTTAAQNAIDRSQGFAVTWTGGNPGSYVFISGTATSSPLLVTVGFTCLVAADAGKFTVPASVMLGLPPGKGGAVLQNDIYAPLTASGLDLGQVVAVISYPTGAVTFK